MSLIAAVYNAVLGLRKRTWASGMTVKKNEIVKSPADNEDYERITATGGGTTDPANNVTDYVARSYTRTVAHPATGYTGGGQAFYGCAKNNFSLTTAAGRTSVLNIMGRGVLHILGLNTYSYGLARVEIFCDGRSVYDQALSGNTTVAIVNIGLPADPYYGYTSSWISPTPNPIIFKRSLQVFVTMTVAGTVGGSFIAYRIGSEA